MQNVLAFLKTYWMSVASGGAVIILLALFAMGFSSNSVALKLKERAATENDIKGLMGQAKNDECIRVQKANAASFTAEYQKVLGVAETMNRYKPLMDGVFPTPSSSTIAFEFKDAYQRAMVDLMNQLQANDIPSEDDRRDEAAEIDEIKQRWNKEDRAAREVGETPRNRREQENDPMMRADYRAAIKRAHSVRMYASLHESRASFHISPIINADIAPDVNQLWLAQVGLWVQQDIVDSIKGLNDSAAEALKEGEAHVEQMPIKRLEGIKVWGYWWSGSPPAVDFPALATPGVISPVPSFTKKICDDKFDVLRVSIQLVVDQRELLNVIDRFCTNRFFQLVYVDYVTLPAGQDNNAGYYYGSAPCVRLQLQFEVYMSHKALAALMPEKVQQAIGVKK